MRSFCFKWYFPLAFFAFVMIPNRGKSFSILAHEAIIDAEWDNLIKPTLLAKYPTATLADLKIAHAYAYGGCLVPDMGYMPFGDPYFTDLLHYVRNGDFVTSLLTDQKNINQYAFALGVLSHYMADKYGHSIATNQTVPLLYPKLQRKFGNVVTYDEDHTSHSRTEFAFDVVQIAKGHYASVAYHDFIGFKIDSALLASCFYKVYGEQLSVLFPNYDKTIKTFRWGVLNLFPALARKAWHLKKTEIRQTDGGINRSIFVRRMNKRMYRKQFGDTLSRPGFAARTVAFIIAILPKIGPLQKLSFKNPGPQGEKLFNQSIDSTLYHYTITVKEAANNSENIANIDFDTGKLTALNEYNLADDTYAEWLLSLQKQNFNNLSEAIKNNILNFFDKTDTRMQTTNPDQYQKVTNALSSLKTATAI